MLRFAHTYYLWALLLVPVLGMLYWMMLRWKKRVLEQFGESSLVARLMPEVSNKKALLKCVLILTSIAFLILSLARPQIGSKLIKVERKGADVIIALDISNSMLAEDIRPNRLEKAKQAISMLIDGFENDRIGIIVFAGRSFTQLPITTDYAAAKLFLSTIEPDLIAEQGTAIGSAIEQSMNSFDNLKGRNKLIVIITDGENFQDDAVAAAKMASDNNVMVSTIGMGLPDGAPIPINKTGAQVTYKKDKDGNTVISKLDEVLLQQIAAAGGGIYVRANNSKVGLARVFEEINKLEKKQYDSRMFEEYEEQYQYFLAFSLLLLVVDLFIFERKTKWFKNIKFFEKINS